MYGYDESPRTPADISLPSHLFPPIDRADGRSNPCGGSPLAEPRPAACPADMGGSRRRRARTHLVDEIVVEGVDMQTPGREEYVGTALLRSGERYFPLARSTSRSLTTVGFPIVVSCPLVTCLLTVQKPDSTERKVPDSAS